MISGDKVEPDLQLRIIRFELRSTLVPRLEGIVAAANGGSSAPANTTVACLVESHATHTGSVARRNSGHLATPPERLPSLEHGHKLALTTPQLRIVHDLGGATDRDGDVGLQLGRVTVECPADCRGAEASVDGVGAAGKLGHGSGLGVHNDVLPGGRGSVRDGGHATDGRDQPGVERAIHDV